MSAQPANDGDRHIRPDALLGDHACDGGIGYTGKAFAPAPRTYQTVDLRRLNYTTRADAGPFPSGGPALGNLYPLIVAALCETGFAIEAGPLESWLN